MLHLLILEDGEAEHLDGFLADLEVDLALIAGIDDRDEGDGLLLRRHSIN